MAKLPYGFDPKFNYLEKDPWVNLKTIAEFLYEAEPIPPDLANWLGEAIRYSNGNPSELMWRLGLKKKRGRPYYKHEDDWLTLGRRVCELEDQGKKAEVALEIVLNESGDKISRTHLQTLRDKYRKACKDAHS